MKNMVSVIIPNYNAKEYIKQCIESVLLQDYKDFEIIIVDDGSTDNSWEIIGEMAAGDERIRPHRQANLNASIARNRGIEIAKGKYLLFLDSDDVLFPNALSKLVTAIEDSESDIAIGNYKQIDRCGRTIRDCNVTKGRDKILNMMDIVNGTPNPSNKLYKKQIIDQYMIRFGNVRIGQDLNFYLKYLAVCKTGTFVQENIYGWRELEGSISNSYNFRIFDITESFKDVRKFYKENELIKLYDDYIKAIEYRHCYLQMEKQKNFSSRKARKVVIEYFSLMLESLDISKCKNLDTVKNDYWKCRLKLCFKTFYASPLYTIVDRKFARRK